REEDSRSASLEAKVQAASTQPANDQLTHTHRQAETQTHTHTETHFIRQKHIPSHRAISYSTQSGPYYTSTPSPSIQWHHSHTCPLHTHAHREHQRNT